MFDYDTLAVIARKSKYFALIYTSGVFSAINTSARAVYYLTLVPLYLQYLGDIVEYSRA